MSKIGQNLSLFFDAVSDQKSKIIYQGTEQKSHVVLKRFFKKFPHSPSLKKVIFLKFCIEPIWGDLSS